MPDYRTLPRHIPGTSDLICRPGRNICPLSGYPGLQLFLELDTLRTGGFEHRAAIAGKGSLVNALAIHAERMLSNLGSELAGGSSIIAYRREELEKYLPSGFLDTFGTCTTIRSQLQVSPITFSFIRRLSGSFWNAYSDGAFQGKGYDFPENLTEGHRFDEPVFVPEIGYIPQDREAVLQTFPGNCRIASETFGRIERHFRCRALEHAFIRLNIGTAIGSDFGPCVRPNFCNPFTYPIFDIDTDRRVDVQYLSQKAYFLWAKRGYRFPIRFDSDELSQAERDMHEFFERLTGESLHSFYEKL